MGKSRRPKRPMTKTNGPAPSVGRGAGGKRTSAGWFARFGERRPILRFVLLFAAFISVFYAVSANAYIDRNCWLPYLDTNAEVSGAILRFFGEKNVSVSGRSIFGRASLSIERGCDAIHPSLLFISAVLASPVTMRRKLPGIVFGTVALMLINLIRILSLYYVQWYFPTAFETMHLDVWQFLFIVLALVFWVIWAWWAMRREAPPISHAHA